MIRVTDKEGNFHFYTEPGHFFALNGNKVSINKTDDPNDQYKNNPGMYGELVAVFFDPISVVVVEENAEDPLHFALK